MSGDLQLSNESNRSPMLNPSLPSSNYPSPIRGYSRYSDVSNCSLSDSDSDSQARSNTTSGGLSPLQGGRNRKHGSKSSWPKAFRRDEKGSRLESSVVISPPTNKIRKEIHPGVAMQVLVQQPDATYPGEVDLGKRYVVALGELARTKKNLQKQRVVVEHMRKEQQQDKQQLEELTQDLDEAIEIVFILYAEYCSKFPSADGKIGSPSKACLNARGQMANAERLEIWLRKMGLADF